MSEETNPFEPPKAEFEREEIVLEPEDDLVDARLGTRFTNYVVDAIVQTVVVMVVSAVGDALASLVVSFFYYLLFEGLFQRTPGKMITRTRVVTTDGERPTFGEILGRTLVRWIPFEPLSFFGRSRRGWHDRWSKTRVVHDKERYRRRKRKRRRYDDDDD